MSLLVAWVAFPAVLAVLAFGCGLALQRVAAITLPGSLVAPAGLAVIVAVGYGTTSGEATAKLTAPLVVLIAAAGFIASSRSQMRVERWALAGAVGVFAIFGTPTILSGQATFAGYLNLDDTSNWFALTNYVIDHGRTAAPPVASTYNAILSFAASGYPVGSFLPLGVGSRVLGQDVAWMFQPYLAFLAGMLALTLDPLLSRIVPVARVRALCVLVAAQPALLFAYAQWGGIKELATAPIAALAIALVPVTVGVRAALPLAVACLAMLAVATPAGLVWVAPAVAWVVGAIAWQHRRRGALKVAAGVAVVGAALAVPSMGAANGFLAPIFHGSGGAFRDQHVLGALYARLDPLQIAGVWPAGDFRLAPRGAAVTDVLLVVLALAALAGLVIAIRRRSWPVVMYCGAVPATGLALFAVGSPWVGAKALVIASPGLLLAACVGCTAVRRRAAAGVAAIAIGGGVLWSNALAYQDATLAPRGQLSELARIGRLAEGRGPTLLMEYNSYGSRYFLRAADAAALSEVRLTPLLDGQPVAAGNWADTDDLQLDGLLAYRTLVIRRSPIASRPPGVYRLVWRGQTYEVWQRAAQATAPAEHLPLDGTFSPVAPAKCQDVRRLAKLAGTQGHLETVARPVPIAVRLARLALPAGWRVQPTKRSVVYPARAGVPWGGRPGDGAMVYPLRSGAVSAIVTVEQPGRYEVWLGGSIYGRASVSIDGRPAGAARHVLNYTGGYISLGVDRLSRGRHRIELAYHGGGVHPGSGGQDVRPFPIGPLVLSRVPDSRAITYVRPGDARTLCGRQLDWIEAVRGQ